MTPLSWWTGNDRLCRPYICPTLLVLSALPSVLTLQVVPGSNCTTQCLSSVSAYTTNGSDIACNDLDYNNTVYGGTFQRCISCEIQSETFNRQTGQTDVGWALCKTFKPPWRHGANAKFLGLADNMRYALDWCLYNYPESKNQTVSNTCSTSCAPISNALETNILMPNASTTYDYCQDPNFLSNVDGCASCYKIIPNQLYLSNCETLA